MFCFRLFGPGRSGVLPLTEAALTAGRSADNDIVLDHPAVPEVAFRLTLEDDGCSLTATEVGSRLAVNGQRTDSTFLMPGDRLEVGPLILVLDIADDEAQTLPQAAAGSCGTRGLEFRQGLARLCALAAEERDLPTLMRNLMGLLLQAFGGNEAFLFTLDAAGRPEVFVSSREGDAKHLFSDTVVAETLRTRKGLVLGNALSDPAFARSQSVSDLGLHSVLCCPITVAGRTSGLIYLGSNRPAVSFDEAALRELEVYALVAGCLINHVAFIARQSRVLASLRAEGDHPGMVAFCPAMKTVVDELRAVAASDLSVLLQGETGTGKDVAAQALHRMSRRSGKPFLVLNCSTLRGELLTSELFGHRKGAFTGAVADHKGLFSSADGGTLFLDEIGDMDLPLQAMLLRTLETGRIRPVGQSAEIAVDVRIACATNRDLEDMVAKGSFRQDLFYRINQHMVRLPPLRERGEDILVLAHHFLEKTRALYPDKRIEGFHPESLEAMMRYAWPGNVRELSNVVVKAVLFANSPLVRVAFPEAKGPWLGLEDATRQFQWEYIQKALVLSGGDKDKAAGLLNIGRSTFFRHLSQGREGNG